MGKALIITIIAVIAVIGLAIYFYTPTSSRPFSIGSACTDWIPVSGTTCAIDADCVTKFANSGPQDPNVQLRCNAGVCEAKFIRCEVTQ